MTRVNTRRCSRQPGGPPRTAAPILGGKLAVGKPAFGNLGLAVLAALGRAPVVWTPNFDRVYERAAELVRAACRYRLASLIAAFIAAALGATIPIGILSWWLVYRVQWF